MENKQVKSPSFQFYPGDFLSDANVLVMSMAERGAYITLLCVCWQQGSLPNDMTRLSKLCGVPLSAFRKLWPALKPCFRSTKEDTGLIHPRLDRERQKQIEYKQAKSESGRIGADKRWHSHSRPIISPMANNGSSSSSSSSFSERERQEHSLTPINLMQDPELTERAGRFLERYAELHQKFRHGAVYLGKMHHDYQESLLLCRAFDDSRLDMIAQLFLVDEDDFSSNGTRTLAKLRSRASDCDERLRKAGK